MSSVIILDYLSGNYNSTVSPLNLKYKNGVEISSIEDLREPFGFKIRSHSQTVRTISGSDISQNFFKDNDSLDVFYSGSKKSHVVLSNEGKYSERITNQQIITNFGQKDFYETNIVFSDNEELKNPLNYFESNKSLLKQTEETSFFTSPSNLNGIVDIFSVRYKLDGRNILSESNGVNGFVGYNETKLKTSNIIEDGYNLNDNSYEFYIDKNSYFFTGSRNLPYDNFTKSILKPFVEYYNDNEKILQYLSGSEDIKNILLTSGSFEIFIFDKSSTGGFINDNSLYGMDSIAFSGFLSE